MDFTEDSDLELVPTITPIRKAGRTAVASRETVHDDVVVAASDLVGEEGKRLLPQSC